MMWLSCELEMNHDFVASFRCMLCKHYENHLQSYKNFSPRWITGSTNKRLRNVIDHAMSEVHKVAMVRFYDKQKKRSGESVVLSTDIGCCLLKLDNGTQLRMQKKFDICYMMAKHSILFAAIVELRSRHGINLGPAYRTLDSAKLFTSYINECQCQQFLSNFYLVLQLMDGTTDAGDPEDELVMLI